MIEMIGKNKMFLVVFILFILSLIIQPVKIFTDENVKNIQSVVLEDFELDANNKPKRLWVALPNRFGRVDNREAGMSLQKVAWVEAWPETYFGVDGKFNDGTGLKVYKTSLGVQVFFNRQGYNTCELYPSEEKDGKMSLKPVEFQGRVQQIDMWIWGANYRYDVEMVIMDQKGFEHRLYVGNLQHIGWKNFTVKMPNNVPQGASQLPRLRQLSLTKIVITTTPEEKVSGTYVYIDHIKYLTDLMETNYDGYNLESTEAVKNLWDKAPKAPSGSDLKP